MSEPTESVRCLLVPIGGTRILLPNSVVAEVANWSDPEPLESAPDWLHGELAWNDWKIPVISYGHMAGTSEAAEGGKGTRILIIRTLSESGSLPFVGIVIRGLPSLVTVTPEVIGNAEEDDSEFVFSRVDINDNAAVIPDLDTLATKVALTAYGDAKATRH